MKPIPLLRGLFPVCSQPADRHRTHFPLRSSAQIPAEEEKSKKAKEKFGARLISTCSSPVTAAFSLPFSPRNAPSAQQPVPLQPWEAPATPKLADTGLSPPTPGIFAPHKVWVRAGLHLRDIRPGLGTSLPRSRYLPAAPAPAADAAGRVPAWAQHQASVPLLPPAREKTTTHHVKNKQKKSPLKCWGPLQLRARASRRRSGAGPPRGLDIYRGHRPGLSYLKARNTFRGDWCWCASSQALYEHGEAGVCRSKLPRKEEGWEKDGRTYRGLTGLTPPPPWPIQRATFWGEVGRGDAAAPGGVGVDGTGAQRELPSPAGGGRSRRLKVINPQLAGKSQRGAFLCACFLTGSQSPLGAEEAAISGTC